MRINNYNFFKVHAWVHCSYFNPVFLPGFPPEDPGCHPGHAAAEQHAEDAGLVQALRRGVDRAGHAATAEHACSQNTHRFISFIYLYKQC